MGDLPNIGDLRIIEDMEEMGGDWSWRFYVERYNEGGSFLWWKWGPSWSRITRGLERHAAARIVEHGKTERVVQ